MGELRNEVSSTVAFFPGPTSNPTYLPPNMSPAGSPKREEPPKLATTSDGWIEQAPSTAAADTKEASPAPSSPKVEAAPADRGISSLASRIGGLTTDSEEPAKPAEETKAAEGELRRAWSQRRGQQSSPPVGDGRQPS